MIMIFILEYVQFLLKYKSVETLFWVIDTLTNQPLDQSQKYFSSLANSSSSDCFHVFYKIFLTKMSK